MNVPSALGLDPTIANAGELTQLRIWALMWTCTQIFDALSFV